MKDGLAARSNMRRHREKEPRRTFLNSAAYGLLTAVPLLAMAAYGGVDAWANGVLLFLCTVVVLLLVADAVRSGTLSLSSNRLQLPLIAVFVLGVIQLLPLGGPPPDSLLADASSSLSLNAYATRLFLVRLASFILFFGTAFVLLDTPQRIKRTAVVIAAFGGSMALFGILQRISGAEAIYGLRPSPQAIFFGPFVNQHHFAAFVEMAFGLVLGLLFGKFDRWAKVLFAAAGAFLLTAAAMTGSRGGMIGIACTGAVFFALHSFDRRGDAKPAGRRRPMIFAAAAAAAVCVIGLVIFLGGGESLLRGTGLQGGSGDVTSGRLDFWQAGIKIFLAHPIIGSGLDSFATAFPQYDRWNGSFRIENAHNDYLQMLAEGGLIGFGCIIAFVILLIKQGLAAVRQSEYRSSALTAGALAGCCGILIHSLFDFPLRTFSNTYFFLLLAVIAVARILPKANERER